MVKKFFSIFNREFNNVHEAAILLGLFAFLSQVLGLFRDRALAYYLGPSQALDVYYAAFRIPDFLYVSVASLASVTVLIPFLTEKFASPEGRPVAKKFMNDIFTVLLMTMVAVSVVLYVVMPFLVPYLAPGFDVEAQKQVVVMSRIMLLSPIFLGVSNLLGSITQLLRKFFVYAFSPILYNIGILIGIFVFLPQWGPMGLAFGVIVGALMHLLIQFPAMIKEGFVPVWSWAINLADIRRVVAISLPRTLTMSLGSLTLLVLVAFASRMNEGSISIFNFSLNLQAVPLGIIGISYSVAVFPLLVRMHAVKDMRGFADTLISTARQITFWSLPIIAFAIVLRAQIVRLVLGSGNFTWNDTRLTAAALAVFVVSIFAASLILLLVRAYYAMGNTRTPLVINSIAAVGTVTLAYGLLAWFDASPAFRETFAGVLRVSDLQGVDVLVLALAYSIGTICNLLLFWLFFSRDFPEISLRPFVRTFVKTAVASVVIGAVTYGVLRLLGTGLVLSTFWSVLLHGVYAGVIGLVAGICTLYALGSEELYAVYDVLHHKFWKAKVIAPEQREL